MNRITITLHDDGTISVAGMDAPDVAEWAHRHNRALCVTLVEPGVDLNGQSVVNFRTELWNEMTKALAGSTDTPHVVEVKW